MRSAPPADRTSSPACGQRRREPAWPLVASKSAFRLDTRRRRGARRVYDPPAADVLRPPRPEEVGFSVRHYELMVILDPDLEERTIAPSLDTFLNVVRTGGGTVEKVDVWGRRRLAFEIDKKAEGIYAVIDLNAEPAVMKELDRQLNLNEAILRTKVIRPELR